MGFSLKNTPIRRKLTLIILLTSVVVMLLMRGTFFTYDLLRLRSTTVRQLTTLGQIVAANSTAALAFDNSADARETLSALRTEEHIAAAALYDRDGRLFAQYPDQLSAGTLPAAPGPAGYRFTGTQLAGFQPVVQGGNKQLGTLYLRFETGAIMSAWIRLSLGLGLGVMAVVLLIAFALSRVLQRQVSQPIVALAATAQVISKDRDYSVRAVKQGDDEVGLLTDSFNQMLAKIGELNRDLEKRVVERTAQLETANKELEAFSYSVSHDLRAPLRHVDGFANLLQNHAAATLDDKGRHYLRTISSSARQMGRLIDDLLAFSRMGRTQLQPAEVDQAALVAAVIREGEFGKNGPTITWDIAPLPRVQADHNLLRQVWVNLIDNAVKYSGKTAAPGITVGSRPDPDTCEQVFFVRDNGAGFDMRYADKLFGVFQRLHGPTEFEGTGIGLANVRRIITRHGGRTWAEGRIGEGATFYFSLPATPVKS